MITQRLDDQPLRFGQASVTELRLSRLGRRQAAAMVARMTDGRPLPAEVVERIVEQTDGVPLFVEELTKTVLESDLVADRGDRYELIAPLSGLAIPESLQASLTARLDRLGRAKEVAQIAAVIGREFSHELLAAVTRCRSPSCARRWRSWSRPSSCSAAASRRMRVYLQAPWCRRPPTGRCCASGARSSTPASRAPSRPTSPRCWRTTPS